MAYPKNVLPTRARLQAMLEEAQSALHIMTDKRSWDVEELHSSTRMIVHLREKLADAQLQREESRAYARQLAASYDALEDRLAAASKSILSMIHAATDAEESMRKDNAELSMLRAQLTDARAEMRHAQDDASMRADANAEKENMLQDALARLADKDADIRKYIVQHEDIYHA